MFLDLSHAVALQGPSSTMSLLGVSLLVSSLLPAHNATPTVKAYSGIVMQDVGEKLNM